MFLNYFVRIIFIYLFIIIKLTLILVDRVLCPQSAKARLAIRYRSRFSPCWIAQAQPNQTGLE